ncbi:MAG: potassium-transporting ATPase subunit KdpC [Acidimicrobiaceae bacterium]|nr:potassium-transporting ATPase subunit KdpC [Acidimicrobiaceae bacterium]
MRRQLLSALGAVLMFSLLTGLAYPLVMTGVSHVLFPSAAQGSLIRSHGRVVGSSLIGQEFVSSAGQPLAQYFQTRPSASNDNGLASGATNLGPSSANLLQSVHQLEVAYRRFNHVPAGVEIPSDAVTTSGSGLDPDISIANARLQAPRVAAARHLPVSVVYSLINSATIHPALGILGEPVVNVLELNVALDSRAH